MHQTTVTAIAPPMRLDLTVVRSPEGADDSVTVTVSGASVLNLIEQLEPAPWMPWFMVWAWHPWKRLLRMWGAPFTPLHLAFPYEVSVTATRRPANPDPWVENGPADRDDKPDVILETEFRRMD